MRIFIIFFLIFLVFTGFSYARSPYFVQPYVYGYGGCGNILPYTVPGGLKGPYGSFITQPPIYMVPFIPPPPSVYNYYSPGYGYSPICRYNCRIGSCR